MLLEDVAIASNHDRPGSACRARLPGAAIEASQHKADPIRLCRETQQIVARAFQIAGFDLRRRTRRRSDVVLARHVAMYLANVAGGASFRDVAQGFSRDRSTVAYACGRIEDLRDDPGLDLSLSLLEGAVRTTFRLPDLH